MSGSERRPVSPEMRALLGVAGVTCFFYAIDHLTLADASLLNKVSPFFVTVFAAIWLGERLTHGDDVLLEALDLDEGDPARRRSRSRRSSQDVAGAGPATGHPGPEP